MQRIYITCFVIILSWINVSAQFHTLQIPHASPSIVETQTLGITKITIEYSSPSVRGRDVWNRVVPFNGQPIAWRAGANMNTRIKFSTDVTINGESIPAGSYGLHMIPKRDDAWELLLAENDQQWGSYYLDVKNDVFKSISVEPGECQHRENLAYEFKGRTDSSLVMSLEWEKMSIPFTIEVDLNKTVIESFRSELLGINTYRWEAWNDAARWCLRRNTNLEEALSWANRSINGGYNGFSANKNLTNLTTKIQILKALGRTDEAMDTKKETAKTAITNPSEANNFGRTLILDKDYEFAKDFFIETCKKFDNPWFLKLGVAVTNYLLENTREAVSVMKEVQEIAPANFKSRLEEITKEMEAGTFEIGRVVR